MPKENKSPDIEVQRRVDLCLTQLLQGWIPYRIGQYVAKMEELRELGKLDSKSGYNKEFDWGVGIRQVYEYCEKANDALAKIKTQKRAATYNLSLARWNEMLRKCLLAKDYTNARLIQKEIDKLTGATEFGAGGGEKPETTKFKLSDGTILEL